MKKTLCLILLFSLLFSFTSCYSKNNKVIGDQSIKDENSSYQEENNTYDSVNTEKDTNDNTLNTEKDTNNSDSLKHHEVDLNINNYETYLKYVAETSVISGAYHPKYSHTISGVLTYAYYEDVTVTFDISYKSSGYQSTTYTGIFTVKLNAAGNAEFSADDEEILNAIGCPRYDRTMTKIFSIKQISGKVMFAI